MALELEIIQEIDYTTLSSSSPCILHEYIQRNGLSICSVCGKERKKMDLSMDAQPDSYNRISLQLDYDRLNIFSKKLDKIGIKAHRDIFLEEFDIIQKRFEELKHENKIKRKYLIPIPFLIQKIIEKHSLDINYSYTPKSLKTKKEFERIYNLLRLRTSS